MALVPGTRFGGYEILTAIGAGGMGEVYRARDAKLQRDVAIKILRADLAADPEHLTRLLREARALASLNHPHIAVIHGLEESGSGRALVLELVEGSTLADRIAAGPLPVEEALDIARQIADALLSAHEQGIVHRDLKPANVKLRPDGIVKVLDFGLAKAVASKSRAVSASSPTITAPVTEAGIVVGTPGYMAPEQIVGQPADQRTDIWAFGCVLYEMLSGRRAFVGGDVASTFSAVLTRDPDWSLLPPAVPPSVVALLRRCMTRDPRRRLGDLSAVQFVLEEQAALASPVLTTTAPRPPRGRWLSAVVVGSMLLGGGLAAAAVWLSMRTPPSRLVKLAIVTPPSAAPSLDQTHDVDVGIAPDGSWITYIGNRSTQLFLRRLDASEPRAIVTTPAYLRGVFVSEDGQWIGYVQNDVSLRKVPSSGGSPVVIATMDGPSRGAAWSARRGIVFATAGIPVLTGLQQVDPAGGPVTVLTTPDAARGELDHVFPQFLPDDRHVLFTILSASGGLDAAQVAVLDLETGAWRTVLSGGYHGRFSPSGHLLYVAGGALRAIGFDPSRLEVHGAPVEVAPRLVVSLEGAAAAFNVARNGTLVYLDAPAGMTTDRRLVWVDRGGRETALDAPVGTYITPRISPDGQRLAVSDTGDLWLVDLAAPRGTRRRLTFAPERDWFPVWTPDGRRLVFASWRGGGSSNLFVQSVEGGVAERLTETPAFQFPTSITPDGAAVIFGEAFSGLRRIQLEPPNAVETLIDTPYDQFNGELSPDGRWLAYEGEHAVHRGQFDVYVRPFPNVDAGPWQVSPAGGLQPLWARSGRELFYREVDGSMMVVRVDVDDGFSTQTPVRLFRGRPYVTRGGDQGRTYDVSSDGERFLMIKDAADAELAPLHIVVVLHLFEELQRMAPP